MSIMTMPMGSSRGRFAGIALVSVVGSLLVAACSVTTNSATAGDAQEPREPPPSEPTSASAPTETTVVPVTSSTTATTIAAPSTTLSASSTTSTTAVATTLPAPLDVFAPGCVVRAEQELSPEGVAATSGNLDVVGLWLENGQIDAINAGDLVDICVGNAVNDINGEPRPQIDEVTRASAIAANVERQQGKLNELFAGFGIADLDIDGISGPRTGQRLCAARLALGLNPAIADMTPGSSEQAALFASTVLPTPASTATQSERWVLIDRTCQIMFVGARDQTVFVFPTSTGSEGFETRDQDRAEAFRFDPALDNGGWHDSSEFPVGVDNPLNGNLYKPLYFDLGQAIHGANNVPPTPASKGCARVSVADQDSLIKWLGLDAATGETWRKSEMNVTVNVQGVFIPR